MKQIKIRIAVAVNQHGDWEAYGASDTDEGYLIKRVAADVDGGLLGAATYWVEAVVSTPDPVRVNGKVIQQGER